MRTRRKTIKEIVQRIQNLPLRPGSLMAYSKKLYSGCPEGFDVYIKADTSSSMFPQFVRSLYNALDYAKSLEREGPRQRQRQRQRRRTSELEEELEDDVEPQVICFLFPLIQFFHFPLIFLFCKLCFDNLNFYLYCRFHYYVLIPMDARKECGIPMFQMQTVISW